ncbi:hypothetical protein CYLTODRAFT_422291 [Cylindrobasidium torrendii FP15055 ss-10]|uniref:GDS1 winged helix domain-containing protein n=1 Tax=Cylindrobasidium torrendii FP15055 ss-10 TaxID=1314674 RepID=A0A0D7BBV9_9AGAR|nr:hypothetical protein CYLTODRAFT_422291 [Cylindrobasidium torrendii FP15055 ss-10]
MTSQAVLSNQASSYAAPRVRQGPTITLKPTVRIKPPVPPKDTARPSKSALQTRSDYADTSSMPPLPSGTVGLHPEDENSKVFQSVARALLSVNNRAMTVKDLAEMCIQQGMGCPSVSAASQAITTYTRDHLKRCDLEQDQPLLLRHSLAGTPSDDLLAPALYSTVGGNGARDARPAAPNRLTNFRKGTVVWYLSRLTGAPCPFSRAGIRLSDHIDPTLVAKRNAKREGSTDQCGDKRKRRSTRECVVRTHVQATQSTTPELALEQEESDREEEPPTKVKLIVRLKPLAIRSVSTTPSQPLSDDTDLDDSMSVDDDRPTSISGDSNYAFNSSSPSVGTGPDPGYRRSSSVPDSLMASPPPDSEEEVDDEDDDSEDDDSDDESYDDDSSSDSTTPEEDEDYESSEFGDADSASESDEDNDADTSLESLGPRSPLLSSPITIPAIKQEPRDVQGILDAWEDLDSFHVGSSGIVDVIGKAATHVLTGAELKVKYEPDLDWDLHRDVSLSPSAVKQEEEDMSLGFDSDSFTSWRSNDPLMSPMSPRHHSPFMDSFPFDDGALLPGRRESESHWDKTGARHFDNMRPRSNTVPAQTPEASAQEVAHQLISFCEALSFKDQDKTETKPSVSVSHPVCVSPGDIRRSTNGWPLSTSPPVGTIQALDPAIVFTQVDGFWVYRTILDGHIIHRRVDSNYVNLSSIMAYSQTPEPVLTTLEGAYRVDNAHYHPTMNGLWVPLVTAQLYVNDHPVPTPLSLSSAGPSTAVLDVFLGNDLPTLFPSSILHNNPWTPPAPTSPAAEERVSAPEIEKPASKSASPFDGPLTEKEEEIFESICVNLEWEPEKMDDSPIAVESTSVSHSRQSSPPESMEEDSRPLRRSRRVADAVKVKAKSTRTPKTKKRR